MTASQPSSRKSSARFSDETTPTGVPVYLHDWFGPGRDAKVVSTRADNVLTFDLRLPTWPFFLVAWLGDVSAVLLIAVRTYRLIFHPELMGGQYQIKPVE